eukprot:jgi/Tetstr1/459589/TSEL_004953.t1
MAEAAASEAQLELVGFHPRERRVKCAHFHPVLPLVALADKDEVVQLWNFESREVVYETQLGGLDDAAHVEMQLQMLAEKDVKFFGPSLSDRMQVSKTPSGSVRSLAFCDAEALHWEAARQTAMRGARLPAVDPASMSPVMKGTRLLMAVCEQKVVMMDLTRSRSTDIPRAALDSKAPTAVAVLQEAQPDSAPVAAVGCSDGVIRCVQLGTNKLIMRLAGLKVAPSCMLALCRSSATGADKLLTGSGDGSLALWDPLIQAGGPGGVKEVAPQGVQKAHEGGVASMALAPPAAGQPLGEAAALRLITLGADSRVAIWSLAPLRELSRVKPLSKVALHSVLYAPRGQAGTGMQAGILLSGANNQVYAMSEAGKIETLVDLTAQLISSGKKAARCSLAVAHPTLPHLLAVATGAGLALLEFVQQGAPPALLTKSMKSGAEAAYQQASGSTQLPSFVLAKDGALWSVTCGLGDGDPPAPVAHAAKPVATLPRSGCVELSTSTCGRLVGVCWPGANTYAVYRCTPGSAPWQQVDTGEGDSVAWAHRGTVFATASVPVMQQQSPGGAKGRSKKSAKGGAQMEAAMAAAREAAAASANVSLREVDMETNKAAVQRSSLDLRGKLPRNVHGGALLGVTYRQQLRSAQGGGNAFQFYSWATLEPTGEVFPEPLWVQWDSYAELCAIGYPSEVLVCRCRPRVERIASLAIPGVTSALWHTRQLYLASPAGVDLAFVDSGGAGEEPHKPTNTAPPPPLPPLLKAVRLAALQLPLACSRLSSKFYRPSACQAQAGVRPFGPLRLLGVREQLLWLVDAWGQPQVVDLGHPSLRLCIQTAAGQEEVARQGAVHGLPSEAHETAAAFLASMSYAGAQESLNLPGVSIHARLGLSLQAGELARAQTYLQALASGVTDAAHLKAGEPAERATPRPSMSDTSSPPSSPWPLGGSPRPRGAPGSSTDEHDLLGVEELSGASTPVAKLSTNDLRELDTAGVPTLPDGNINWDAALAPPATGRARRRADALSCLPHALRLVDEALQSGDHPTAAGALGVVAAAAGCAAPGSALAHAVQLRMAQCGMTDTASSLLAAHAAEATASAAANRDAVLCAALAGEAGPVADLLAGLPPERALYHQAWGSAEQLRVSLAEWNAQLRQASCGVFEVAPSF